MKNRSIRITFVFMMVFIGLQAQKAENTEKEKLSYYEQRAKEDAQYEQSLNSENKKEEAPFWKDQEAYEKNLKKKDRKAYRAYMKGKRDAYLAHRAHCDNHCHHSDYYHHHADFYYSYHYYDQGYPRRTNTVYTGVRIATPRVGIGLHL